MTPPPAPANRSPVSPATPAVPTPPNALFARSAFVRRRSRRRRPPRAISDDGSYVFFDTADALVPTDINERIDVYEWHEGPSR